MSVATESGRDRLTPTHSLTHSHACSLARSLDLPPSRFSSLLPSFSESQLLSVKWRCRRPKRELCLSVLLRAKGTKIQNSKRRFRTDGRTDRDRKGLRSTPGAENYDERRTTETRESKRGEKYARLLPIGAVSHAVSPVLHLLRATFTPFTAAPPKLSLSRPLSNYVLFSMHPRISRTVPGKFLRPGGGGGGMNA